MLTGEASITAKICAFTRAHHSIYTQKPIYDDYYAYELLGHDDYEYIKKRIIGILSEKCWEIPTLDTWDKFINQLISPIILSRVNYAETKLENFSQEKKEPIQYVICGAGLDSFIFRNSSQNIRIFELDHPDTQRYKLERLAQLGWNIPNNAHLISIDFEKQNMKDVLLEAGFDPKVKTFFAILGVTYYLTLDTFAETLKNIAELSQAKSQIVFDYPDKEIVKSGHMNPRMAALVDITDSLGEKMMGGMAYSELADVFDGIGFHISEHVTPQIIQETYFEGREDDLNAYENISFIMAETNSK
jgi:methyltransferase (TIGR00027 family)